MFEENRFEDVLKSLRVRQGKMWTQAKTAQSLGVSLRTYVGWENGESLPRGRDLKNVAVTFKLSETETDALFRAAGRFAPEIQNLPFPPNPFFTGRQSLLHQLEQLFERNQHIAITQPISVSGLGGIGKTQLALEYAHRCHPKVYRSVLWVNAADKATLEASYLSLAQLLQLPESREREIERIVEAVKMWLEEHSRWLLILDNADDLSLACSFLPAKPRGHILLTTRSQIVGTLATLLPIEAPSPQEGLLFLLRRSGMLKPGTTVGTIEASTRGEAEALVELLAGHPLALDQVGAYIEEISDLSDEAASTSFADYRQLYQQWQSTLLNRRGSFGGEHPESVATTIEISFQKACEQHPSCANILSFCSLLHPDAIPEELLCDETVLGLHPLHFNEAIVALRRYSLVKRDAERKVLSVHRLVQAVIRESMTQEQFRQWARRAVWALNKAFPEERFEQWSRSEQLLPHVQLCTTWIEGETLSMPEAAYLLHKAGVYLRDRGQYKDAELLLTRAISMRERYLGTEHPDTARSLHNLALLYRSQGKYELAETFYQRGLAIREQHLGAKHPHTADSLNDLARLYEDQGKYEQAERLFQQALTIYEHHLGTEHPRTADSLNDLAILYWRQGKYEQAEPLYQQALAIREQHLGTEHPYIADSLNNLAILYRDQGKYKQAERLFQQALTIYEHHLGAEHPRTANSLNDLAILYQFQGRDEQAETFYQRALAIYEQHLGTEHPLIAHPLYGLAQLYQHQGRDEQAKTFYQRALSIREQSLGETHPETESTRKAYAAFLQRTECDEDPGPR